MSKQNGFTLIELMISSLIGLIILTGILNLFINTNRNVTLSDALSQNQETGRFTMEYLTNYVRKAGYSEDDVNARPDTLLVPHGAITCLAADGEEFYACAANNPSNARGDRLAIPFAIMPGQQIRSCTGYLIGSDPNPPTEAASVFWVSNSNTDGSDYDLRCRTYDITNRKWLVDEGGAVTIINNVESFEYQVGLSEFKSEQNAARYVSPDRVTQSELALIRSFRISILTTSRNELDGEKIQQSIDIDRPSYSLMDSPDVQFPDTNLRSIFTNTIELPNEISGVDSSDAI